MKLPRRPDDHHLLLPRLLARNVALLHEASPTLPDGRYLHWDQLRHRPPPEASLTVEEWWAVMRFARERKARRVEPMVRCYGIPFSVVDLASIQRSLHEFDRANVGQTILSALGNPDAQVEYQVRQLIEEAISSSEIEGARPTTRELARQMLRERRAPASRDERMIMNNLRAMERLGELHSERVAVLRLLMRGILRGGRTAHFIVKLRSQPSLAWPLPTSQARTHSRR